jgi:hypothetical protein
MLSELIGALSLMLMAALSHFLQEGKIPPMFPSTAHWLRLFTNWQIGLVTVKARKSGVASVIRYKDPVGREACGVLVLPWSVMVLVAGFISVGIFVILIRNWLASTWLISRAAPAHLGITAFIVSFMAFVVGSILAGWKRRAPLTYGIAEAVFGVFSVASATYLLWDKPAKFVGIGSGLYVISRGIDNFLNGAIEEIKKKRIQITLTLSNRGLPIWTVSESDLLAAFENHTGPSAT